MRPPLDLADKYWYCLGVPIVGASMSAQLPSVEGSQVKIVVSIELRRLDPLSTQPWDFFINTPALFYSNFTIEHNWYHA